MNKKRRKWIDTLANQLENISIEIDDIISEEETYYENMPESFQDGEKGETCQAAIECLNTARDSLADTIEQLNEASQ